MSEPTLRLLLEPPAKLLEVEGGALLVVEAAEDGRVVIDGVDGGEEGSDWVACWDVCGEVCGFVSERP